MIGPRGPLPVRRMTAHWVVLIAAALTTLVAAAVGAALAAFAGQALRQAVRHDLAAAPGTSLDLSAAAGNGDVNSDSAAGPLTRLCSRRTWSRSAPCRTSGTAGCSPAPPSSPRYSRISGPAACLVVFLLTARMIALRRSAELTIRRARGASLRQIGAATALGVALGCVPAAVAGAGLAVLLVPGPAPAGGWWAPALPAFALVLALSVAAFAGMVRSAVSGGDVTASWQATGADATVAASFLSTPGATIDPAALRAAAGAPGVTRSAAVWQAAWTTPGGLRLTGIVVDPASYAALVAATQTFPRLPAGGAFVIMPLSAMHSTAIPPAPVGFNELLLAGADIDKARVAAVVREMIPGGRATFRSDILDGLITAPLQHGAFLLFTLALTAAAVLGLTVMLLELALGAAERETTLARLATMGLGEGQRARLVVLEVLPAVAAAAVATGACALALPWVVAPAVDLSVFTGSSAPVALTPDVASVALPLAGLLAVTFVALVIEIRTGRRRVAVSLRAGG